MHPSSKHTRAFTFIELLVTMTLVAILAGIAYPVIIGVMERARKTQAKNDLTQIVTAVNGYYTEYGKYPLTSGTDVTFTGTTAGIVSGSSNAALFDVLRNNINPAGPNYATVTSSNPRGIVFIQPPDSKVSNPARAGIGRTGAETGIWFDPWGSPYNIAIDGAYDNQLGNPYSLNAGGAIIGGVMTLQTGVIGWSFGKDAQSQSVPGPAPNKNAEPKHRRHTFVAMISGRLAPPVC